MGCFIPSLLPASGGVAVGTWVLASLAMRSWWAVMEGRKGTGVGGMR
jgi:hypothetical protein